MASLGVSSCIAGHWGGQHGAASAGDDGKTTMDDPRPWVGAWACAPQLTEAGNMPPSPSLSGNTLRQIVYPTLGGHQLRVRLSNAYGRAPVTMNAVHLADSTGASAIDPATNRALKFSGRETVTIAAGGTVISDAFDYPFKALAKLAVSIEFGSAPNEVTGHPGSRTTSYLQSGAAVSATSLPDAVTTDHWYFVSGIDVLADDASAVVAIGDSITDGRGSTTNGNDRWPDHLARRLQANAATRSVAVLNQGIGGNAVLSGGLGPTAMTRFDRDVLNQRGARWVIVLEGVNDIGGSSGTSVATGLIAAYQELIEKAHGRGLRAYGVPILPFEGSSYSKAEHEEARRSVNDWIRTSGKFDAVIDLDAAVRDPAHPSRLLPTYDSGDHLHLSPDGYRAMADAIDLKLFVR
jgi:lysophospholipase L1-like esterase